MSLLIDALRKAEQDRAQSRAKTDLSIDALSLEPLEPAIAPATTAPLATASADQAAAANLFAAKQPNGPRDRLRAIAIFGLLGASAVALYLWWQWPAQVPPRLPPPAPLATRPAPPEAAPKAPLARSPAAQPAPVAPPDTPPRPTEASRLAQRGALGQAPAAPLPMPPADPASTPHFRRTQVPPPAVPQNLAAAYQAYTAGDLDTARRHYLAHLKHDPNNADALNGLGAIALHEGQPEQAARWFHRTLVADPGNTSAIAGLGALVDRPAGEREAALRQALAQHPEAPGAAFSLGNVLAGQGRWAEAQQAYFQAHVQDPDNPDYLLNLGVSLDRLGERRLAHDYYSQALDAARRRPAEFDPAPVLARRDALAKALP